MKANPGNLKAAWKAYKASSEYRRSKGKAAPRKAAAKPCPPKKTSKRKKKSTRKRSASPRASAPSPSRTGNMESAIRTVAAGSLVTGGLALTEQFGVSEGSVPVPAGMKHINRVDIAASSLGAIDGIVAVKLSGNGLGQGGEQWIIGPALGVAAAGPLVAGQSVSRDVRIPVKPQNNIVVTVYVTTNITGDCAVALQFV